MLTFYFSDGLKLKTKRDFKIEIEKVMQARKLIKQKNEVDSSSIHLTPPFK